MSEKKIMSSWDWIELARQYFLLAAEDRNLPSSVKDDFMSTAAKIEYAQATDNIIRAVEVVNEVWIPRVDNE